MPMQRCAVHVQAHTKRHAEKGTVILDNLYFLLFVKNCFHIIT